MTGTPPTDRTAVCVFAVRRGRGPELPSHLSGHDGGGPLRLLPVGALWAVVQDVPADAYGEQALHGRLSEPQTLERCVRAHHEVVTAFAARGCAVPLPLATLFHSQERAKATLVENAPRFERTLARIAGRTEWAVKVNLISKGGPAESDGPAGGGDRPVAGGGPADGDDTPRPTGRAYLTRLRGRQQDRESRRERAVRAAELLDRAVLSLADGTVRRRPHGTEITGRDRTQIMNTAYLVPEDHGRRLAELLEQLRAEPEFMDTELEVTGPWVPYSFVDPTGFTEVAGNRAGPPGADTAAREHGAAAADPDHGSAQAAREHGSTVGSHS
ncbi:GvpL/GvpF family gas vesicle protein [Streptomyces sp. NPDC091272]|uniref:GvpL/GvpF family gas vesicle protein n=1 Tax=Streptomyces sp. NPDC091272 TaxID=3365981 RepID=UPI0038016254